MDGHQNSLADKSCQLHRLKLIMFYGQILFDFDQNCYKVVEKLSGWSETFEIFFPPPVT